LIWTLVITLGCMDKLEKKNLPILRS
jgi:hypothetical protein